MLQWLYPVVQGAFSHFLPNILQIGGNELKTFAHQVLLFTFKQFDYEDIRIKVYANCGKKARRSQFNTLTMAAWLDAVIRWHDIIDNKLHCSLSMACEIKEIKVYRYAKNCECDEIRNLGWNDTMEKLEILWEFALLT